MYITLQQRAQKRGSLHLKMEEISPKLAVLAHSLIPMPGLGLAGQVSTVVMLLLILIVQIVIINVGHCTVRMLEVIVRMLSKVHDYGGDGSERICLILV